MYHDRDSQMASVSYSGKSKQSDSSQLPRDLSYDLDTPFDVQVVRNEISVWRQFSDFFYGWKHSKMRASYFNNICGLCLGRTNDKRLLKRFRDNGYQRLNRFIKRLNRREVQLLDSKLLTWCCVNLIVYYEHNYRNAKGCRVFESQRKLYGSRILFCSMINLEMPEKQSDIIRSCVSYFTKTYQWDMEETVKFVFQELLAMVTKQEMVLTKIIKEIEVYQREGQLEQAQMMTSSLAIILENIYWDTHKFNFKLQSCFSTMLKLYLINDFNSARSPTVRTTNIKFRIQMQNCIRLFISNIKDNKGLVTTMDSIALVLLDSQVTEEDRLDLNEMIIYCAQRLHTRLYRESITPELLDYLLKSVKSNYRNAAMTSQKIFQHLLDRRGNMKFFLEPIYYFKGRSNFSVNMEYRREDVYFFRSFSQEFFGGIYKCISKYTETANLMVTYTTLCLVLTEIPEPITTINIIHMMIRTQNNILKHKDEYTLKTKAHIHAIVASILSLICLIHEEEVLALTKYVQKVVSYRNENSPHLLPPLSPHYNIASHHTTDYHNELYFLEDEILFALKQCWLGRRRSK